MIAKSKDYLNALKRLKDEYDAFYITNKYSTFETCTHPKEFNLLSQVKGDNVKNALMWIHDCWDCYYRNEELPIGNAFDYLQKCIYKMFPTEFADADVAELDMREPE